MKKGIISIVLFWLALALLANVTFSQSSLASCDEGGGTLLHPGDTYTTGNGYRLVFTGSLNGWSYCVECQNKSSALFRVFDASGNDATGGLRASFYGAYTNNFNEYSPINGTPKQVNTYTNYFEFLGDGQVLLIETDNNGSTMKWSTCRSDASPDSVRVNIAEKPPSAPSAYNITNYPGFDGACPGDQTNMSAQGYRLWDYADQDVQLGNFTFVFESTKAQSDTSKYVNATVFDDEGLFAGSIVIPDNSTSVFVPPSSDYLYNLSVCRISPGFGNSEWAEIKIDKTQISQPAAQNTMENQSLPLPSANLTDNTINNQSTDMNLTENINNSQNQSNTTQLTKLENGTQLNKTDEPDNTQTENLTPGINYTENRPVPPVQPVQQTGLLDEIVGFFKSLFGMK